MKFKPKLFLLFILNSLLTTCFAQNPNIENDLINLIKPFKGKVGISFLNLKTDEKISINGNEKFPMQSVFKFPLALAVFDQIDKGKLKLDQKINLKKADLLPETHSPLREKYPNGNPAIELREILEKTVAESDNNGCDFQFKLIGGCKAVNDFIHKQGVNNINIVGTEEEMHKDSKIQYANFSTPEAMTALFSMFYKKEILSKASTESLWKILTETETAPNRIKAGLPKTTILGHKSGWSGTDDKGFTSAINDAGIFILPNGEAVAITIFISDTSEKTEKSDELGAKISKLAYEHFLKK